MNDVRVLNVLTATQSINPAGHAIELVSGHKILGFSQTRESTSLNIWYEMTTVTPR